MLNITIRQMRALVAIAAEGKVISASRALGLTSPAVTLQLKQVEDEVGVQLFDRTVQGMRPTTAGEVFIDAAREVLDRITQLETELDAVRGGRLGSLRVGMVSSAHYLAPHISETFAQLCPDIELEVMTGSRLQTMNRLKANDVDIVMTARPPRDVSVRAVAFAEYRLVMIAHPTHPLAGRVNIPLTEILGEHFIVREPGSGPRQSIDAFLSPTRGEPNFSYTEMNSNLVIKQAVLADLGIAFVATHTVATELASRRLTALDVEGLPLCLQWFAISRSDRSVSPAMARFHDFLKHQGLHFLEPGDAIYAND